MCECANSNILGSSKKKFSDVSIISSSAAAHAARCQTCPLSLSHWTSDPILVSNNGELAHSVDTRALMRMQALEKEVTCV